MKTVIDEFADIKVMRFEVPGWDSLTLQQKEYALAGIAKPLSVLFSVGMDIAMA